MIRLSRPGSRNCLCLIPDEGSGRVIKTGRTT